MTSIKTRTALVSTLALCAMPAPALAAKDTSPPLVNGVKCSYTVPKKFSAKKALRRGIPVTVNCTGPANGLAAATLWGRKVSDYVARRYSEGSPGAGMQAEPRDLPAGKSTLRMKVRPWAKGFFRRFAKYRPFRIHTNFATKRVDGEYWSFSNVKTKIVR